MGWTSFQTRRRTEMGRLWNRLVRMNANRLTKKIFLWDKRLCKRNWSSELEKLFSDAGFETEFSENSPVKAKKKKHMCLWSDCFSKIDAGTLFFFFFLLVRFINRGKRSEMVSVVSRYERNEIWIEYIYLPYFLSIKLPYFLGKYKCYTCSIKKNPHFNIWCFSI